MPYTKGSQLVGTAAKIAGLTLGEKQMFRRLREDKILISKGLNKNVPYSKAIDAGLFEVSGYYLNIGPDKDIPRFVRTTYVTPKGIAWLRTRYPEFIRKPVEPRNEVVYGQQQLQL